MVMLKDQDIFEVSTLCQDKSRDCKLSANKETRKSDRGIINQFNEKLRLLQSSSPFRSSHRSFSVKKGVLRNSTKFFSFVTNVKPFNAFYETVF